VNMAGDCPFCGSDAISALTPAVTGVSGFRCQACARIFYVASVEVAERIHEAQTKGDSPETDAPAIRSATGGNRQTT
jgi:transposase-like protein